MIHVRRKTIALWCLELRGFQLGDEEGRKARSNPAIMQLLHVVVETISDSGEGLMLQFPLIPHYFHG